MVKKVASYHSSSKAHMPIELFSGARWLVVLMSGDNEDRDECSYIASKQANSGCMDFMDQVARISNRM